MCSIFSILGAIFALFLCSAHAKHMWLRIYPFTAGDCSGPPIYGNVDVPRDTCTVIPFGGSSIRISEVEQGDWTRDLNKGPTGCYFYAYTQYGCLERYLDLIVDPGDVMNLCIPSRDANDPILSASFTCIYGEPPRRRWALPPAANRTTNALNMTSPEFASAYLRGKAVLDELRKVNGTTRSNITIVSHAARNGYNATSTTIDSSKINTDGTAQNISVRSVNNHGPAFINGERNVNLTHKTNDSNPVSARSANFHGPAFINEKPKFSSSHKLTRGKPETEPSIVSGIFDSNSTHEFNNSKLESPVVPITNGTHGQVHFMGTPTTADSHKDSEGSESSEKDSDDSDDSDDDSDWSDDDGDDDGDEYESYRNSTSLGNSTSQKRGLMWWLGPRIGVWMLHPWTGSILCYTCYAKGHSELSRFECRWGYKHHADCGEKPPAPIYTKTVTVQPVVTVTPVPEPPSIRKRSWHLPVYLQNPWYPGITVCAYAEWEGRGRRWNQEVRIEQLHKKLYRCNKSRLAQNIAVWVRTTTSIAPVKTVSIIKPQFNSVIPPAATVVSTVPEAESPSGKRTTTSFISMDTPTSSVAPSESTTSATSSVPTELPSMSLPIIPGILSVMKASFPSTVPITAVGTVYPPIPSATDSRRPNLATYVEPPDVHPFSMVVASRRSVVIEPSIHLNAYAGVFTTTVVAGASGAPEPESELGFEPEPTSQSQPQNMHVDPRGGGFSTVIGSHINDTP